MSGVSSEYRIKYTCDIRVTIMLIHSEKNNRTLFPAAILSHLKAFLLSFPTSHKLLSLSLSKQKAGSGRRACPTWAQHNQTPIADQSLQGWYNKMQLTTWERHSECEWAGVSVHVCVSVCYSDDTEWGGGLLFCTREDSWLVETDKSVNCRINGSGHCVSIKLSLDIIEEILMKELVHWSDISICQPWQEMTKSNFSR